MLRNRGMRFVTAILACIVTVCIFQGLFGLFLPDANPNSIEVEKPALDYSRWALVFAFTSGFLCLLLGDILNLDALNEGLLGALKRLVFDALALIMAFLQIVIAMECASSSNKIVGVFNLAIALTCMTSGTITCFMFLVATSRGFSSKLAPFYAPTAMVISFIIGLIVSALNIRGDGLLICTFVLAVLIVGGMIYYRVKEGGAFTDIDDENYSSGYSPRKSRASASSSSSSSSGSSYSSSSSGYSGSSSSGSGRKSDGTAINGEMSRLASNCARRYDGNTYGDYIDVRFHFDHWLGKEVQFTAEATLHFSKYTCSDNGRMESAVDTLMDKYDEAIGDLQSKASDVIDRLQDKYSNYDNIENIRVKPSKPSIETE